MIQVHLNAMLDKLLRAFPENMHSFIKENAYFAGGCVVDLVLGDEVRDYDVFLKTEEAAVKTREFFSVPANRNEFVKVVTDNAVTFVVDGVPFQVITRFYGPTERVFKSFDFTHCKSFYDPHTNTLTYDEDIIKNKVLVYDGMKDEFTLNTLKRLCKFVSRGWVPTNETILNLHRAIQNRPPIDNPEEHRAQTVGFYGSSFK